MMNRAAFWSIGVLLLTCAAVAAEPEDRCRPVDHPTAQADGEPAEVLPQASVDAANADGDLVWRHSCDGILVTATTGSGADVGIPGAGEGTAILQSVTPTGGGASGPGGLDTGSRVDAPQDEPAKAPASTKNAPSDQDGAVAAASLTGMEFVDRFFRYVANRPRERATQTEAPAPTVFTSDPPPASNAPTPPSALVGGPYYCDPVHGDTVAGDGSASRPWGTLQSALEAGRLTAVLRDGALVVCLPGYHGQWDFGRHLRPPHSGMSITVRGNGDARVGRMVVKGMSNWRFVGLSISPEHGRLVQDPTINPRIILYGYNNHHLAFENCTIRTVADRTGWGINEWTDRVWGGFDIRASDTIYRNLDISTVHFGIKGVAANCLVERCTIDGFTDGITVGGTGVTIQDNTIVNVYGDRHGTHEDAIQGWGADGSNLLIQRNTILARTNPARPIDGLQGIFLEFDVARRVRIANNVVLCESNHGIKVGEGPDDVLEDMAIVNNTVVKGYGTTSGTPDIGFQKTMPTNVLIRNNVAHGFPRPNAAARVVVDHNFDIDTGDPLREFVDYPRGDVHLAAAARLIDAGNPVGAPEDDRDGNPRDPAVDIGAYEFGG